MVKVCKDWFPFGYSKYQKSDGFPMNPILKNQLDILLKNIKNDWDFTIVITGGGEVRVGKSVLAMQIAAYWTYMVKKLYDIECPFDVDTNFVFTGDRLIQTGNELGQKYPYSALIFDEAGSDLEGRKVIQSSTQAVLDYFRECGQYNMLNIIVMPEFFDLPKGIALSRSIFLIDVTYEANEEGIFKRGIYNFYSRPNKKYLYLKGKRELDYSVGKMDFRGNFSNFYPIDENKYRKLKQIALSKRQSKREGKYINQRDASWYLLYTRFNMSAEEIAKNLGELTGIPITRQAVSDGIGNFTKENE